ncbi:MAG: protein-glutamate O-methyltransferase CheR [Leptospiraceae bacterium]|nr:protein-glutamate O-methyltransferase CheR [Leptospiraceae bacterium]MCP5495695.1 protein-glutamate O-methyltransferase CheR [Leptospiraceae bacterium]
MKITELEKIEIDLLLQGIFLRYGYDFSEYSYASIKRRLSNRIEHENLSHFSELLPKVLHNEEFFNHFLSDLSVGVTEFFRNPSFFLYIRERIIPILKSYPFIKIWHAGCSTGEEAYSMAIVLAEEQFYERAHVYATDFNSRSLEIAREGIYALPSIQDAKENYLQSGGKNQFEHYYHSKYKSVKFHNSIKKNIIFSYHNLVTDSSFGEMNMIVCHNVLIYFNRNLQNKVLKLFQNSLCFGGFLCLGDKETIEYSDVSKQFELISKKNKIYKKITN